MFSISDKNCLIEYGSLLQMAEDKKFYYGKGIGSYLQDSIVNVRGQFDDLI